MNVLGNKEDMVNHPSHYTTGGIETIDFIEAKELGFNLGNVVKYVARCGHKKSQGMSDGTKALQDLRKASWYLQREITLREKSLMYISTEEEGVTNIK